ncbi:MAG: hypothetical protein PHD76_04495 [Methylacidiphilales bacterium]|nr:hypothetical protein [Candidatus Methylacidiphilales bacterium]
MRSHYFTFILLLVALTQGGFNPAVAGELDNPTFILHLERSHTKQLKDDAKLGHGKTTDTTISFLLDVSNLHPNPTDEIQARVCVVTEPNDWKDKPTLTASILPAKTGLKADAQTTVTLNIGELEVKELNTTNVNTNMLWRGGTKLAGYQVDITYKGQVVLTENSGGAKAHKAIEDLLAGNK